MRIVQVPVDNDGRSPFRAALESGDFAKIEGTLAPDINYRGPFETHEGHDSVVTVLRAIGNVLAPTFAYQWHLCAGDREVLCFTSRVGNREIEGVDLLRYNEAGQVAELVMMLRPAAALIILRDLVMARLKTTASEASP